MTPEQLTGTLVAAITKMEEHPLPKLEEGKEVGILVKTSGKTDTVFLLVTIGPAVKHGLRYGQYSAFIHVQSKSIEGIPQTDWVHFCRTDDVDEALQQLEIAVTDCRDDFNGGKDFGDAEVMAVCVDNPFAHPAHSEAEVIKGVAERSDWFCLSA